VLKACVVEIEKKKQRRLVCDRETNKPAKYVTYMYTNDNLFYRIDR